MVMMIMMNKNFNCFVFRAGRYLQASGRLVCLEAARPNRSLWGAKLGTFRCTGGGIQAGLKHAGV